MKNYYLPAQVIGQTVVTPTITAINMENIVVVGQIHFVLGLFNVRV